MKDKNRIFNVAIAGCGAISGSYLKAAPMFAKQYRIYCCCDTMQKRAEQFAEKANCKALSWDEVLADPEVDMVINLTPHTFHAKLNLEAINAGKHVYSEKPLAGTLEEAKAILDAAKANNVRIGSAPDTILGASHQGARKMLDDGLIGRPIAAMTMWIWHGPDSFSHAPMFYGANAGPTLDQGIYHIVTMIDFFGPVKSVSAKQTQGDKTRRVGAVVSDAYADRYKPYDPYPVEVMTHDTAIIEFESGVILTYIASNEAYQTSLSGQEIYGTTGAIRVENPEKFGLEPNKICCRNDNQWLPAPTPFCYRGESRGVGAADMISAIRNDRVHRCSGELAYHALEVMLAIRKSSQEHRIVEIESTCERSVLLPEAAYPGDFE